MSMHPVEITRTLWLAVDLNRRMPDAKSFREYRLCVREHGLMVCRVGAGDVRRKRYKAAGDSPDVQVVNMRDVRYFEQRLTHGIDVHMTGCTFHQDRDRLRDQ